MEITGINGTAKVFTNNVEEPAIEQIKQYLNNEASIDSFTRIMPDVHYGASCVIGFTSSLTDRVVPDIVGVDISCGVLSACIGKIDDIDFSRLDKIIREYIPSGFNHRSIPYEDLESVATYRKIDLDSFKKELNEICDRINHPKERALCSIGTLGGGNHFIELDKDEDGQFWITVHSGSRGFGLNIAKYHQNIANKHNKEYFDKKYSDVLGKYNKKLATISDRKKEEKERIPFLVGEEKDLYMKDSKIAAKFAELSRYSMIRCIASNYFGDDSFDLKYVESVHNYIDNTDNIIRKGAIAARLGDDVIIPFNMRDGLIIGKGKGNADWNNSAPHGSGRVMGRKEAFRRLNITNYETTMKEANIWSSCVTKETLDEAPDVYKNTEEIISYLEPTVEIRNRLKPVYNFKASESDN